MAIKVSVKVQFVGLMPTLFAHCEHCMDVMHQTGMRPYSEQLEEYPREVVDQYFQVSEIAQKLREEFKDKVSFDVIDSASPQGFWMTLRHRIYRTPCVMIRGKKEFYGIPKYEQLREKVRLALESA